MIARYDTTPGKKIVPGTIWWQRENWKERFCFPMSAKVLKAGNIPTPPGFVPTHYVGAMDAWWFWRKEIAPVIIFYLRTRIWWFAVGKQAYELGFIQVEPKEKITWWWFLKVFKPIKSNVQ